MRASTWGMTDLNRESRIRQPGPSVGQLPLPRAAHHLTPRPCLTATDPNSALTGPAASALQDLQPSRATWELSPISTRRLAAWHLLPEHSMVAATQITGPRRGKNVAGIYTRNSYMDRALRIYVIYMGA